MRTSQKFYAEMAKVIDDPRSEDRAAAGDASSVARRRASIPKCIACSNSVSKQMYPGVTVIPSMSTGASDKAQLRAKGQQSYGIGPAATREDSIDYGAHSDVERLAETSIYPFVEFVWNLVTEMAAHQN